MSELEQTMVIEKMNKLTEEDRRFLLGVMAGLTARKEGKKMFNDDLIKFRDGLLSMKRKLEKNGTDINYRAEKVNDVCYRILVEISAGGTDAKSKSEMS